jgi:hypothetical protein
MIYIILLLRKNIIQHTYAGYALKNKLYNLRFSKKEKKLINGIYINSIRQLRTIISYGIYNNILSVKEVLI